MSLNGKQMGLRLSPTMASDLAIAAIALDRSEADVIRVGLAALFEAIGLEGSGDDLKARRVAVTILRGREPPPPPTRHGMAPPEVRR